jgi:hypothetical protein
LWSGGVEKLNEMKYALAILMLIFLASCTGLKNLNPTIGSAKPPLVKDSTKTVKP